MPNRTRQYHQCPRMRHRLAALRLLMLVVLLGVTLPLQQAVAASVQTILLSASPTGIALAPDGTVIVSNGRSYTISIVDPNSATSRDVPVGMLPLAPALDPLHGRAFIASSAEPVVSVYNLASQQIEASLALAGPATAVGIDASAHRLYVAVQPNVLQVFDTASLAPIATSTAGWNVNALAVDSARARLAVLSRDDALVTWFNSDGVMIGQRFVGFQTRRLVHVEVTPPSEPGQPPAVDTHWETVNVSNEPSAIAIDSGSGWAWVTGELTGKLIGTDVNTEHPVHYAVGSKPRALAVLNGQAYVANWGDNTISLVNLADGASRKQMVGYAPSAVVLDASHGRLLIAENIRNALGVLDVNTLAYERIALGRGPSAMAWDEAHNRVVVANSGSNSLSIVSLP